MFAARLGIHERAGDADVSLHGDRREVVGVAQQDGQVDAVAEKAFRLVLEYQQVVDDVVDDGHPGDGVGESKADDEGVRGLPPSRPPPDEGVRHHGVQQNHRRPQEEEGDVEDEIAHGDGGAVEGMEDHEAWVVQLVSGIHSGFMVSV